MVFSPLAFGDSFTLGSSYGYTTLTGQIVAGGIFGSTLNGVPVGFVVCDDTANESYMGSTWPVNIEFLTGTWDHLPSPMFSSAGIGTYEKAAILEHDMGLPANATQQNQNLLQAAIWDLFLPGSGTATTGLPAGADNVLLAQVAGEVNDFQYSGEIITPIGGGIGNQEFLLLDATPDPSPVPESSTGLLMALGLLFVSLPAGYKLRTHRA